MNQDFTVKKSNICLKKNSCRGFHLKKIPAQAKKNSYKLKIPHPPPPPTFLMVRSQGAGVYVLGEGPSLFSFALGG